MEPSAPLPAYFLRRYLEHCGTSPTYRERLNAVGLALGRELDPGRPPFVFVGNLDAAEHYLTFGISPHSPRRGDPKPPATEFADRMAAFAGETFSHPMHERFAHLLWGVLGVDPSGPRWLHEHGYVSFDLVPYATSDGKWPSRSWANAQARELVREHLAGCLGLVDRTKVRLAIFAGRDWERLLVEAPAARRIDGIARESGTEAPRVGGNGRVRIHVGRFDAMPALVIGHLIHSQWFLPSAARAWELGRRIRELNSRGADRTSSLPGCSLDGRGGGGHRWQAQPEALPTMPPTDLGDEPAGRTERSAHERP